MEFRKERFGKRSDRYPRNDRTQKGQRGSRTSGSRYGRDSGEGSRYGRDSSEGSRYGGGSSFRRESDEGTRMQRTNVVCADCGNDCVIPFKPKDSRPVYCRDCFQDHKPQERSDSRFNRTDRGSRYERDSDRGSRFDRNSDSDSRYGQNTRSRFEKDRTPIHSRDSFRKNRFNKPNDFVNQKRKNKYNSDDSDLFYSTLRTKLFKILGGKRCSNCGFEDERALGFGHVDDEESFDYGQRGGSVSSWEKYISEPELARKSLHILCFNCNQINQK
ncbi:MAG TPA: CxxC-x17-CxxC domain-containing protein [Nitrosopumilaceae archaeon]|nr:CxxC-x17-CxxC domain-containing protein [Nitrosopumilaceae archaeon]